MDPNGTAAESVVPESDQTRLRRRWSRKRSQKRKRKKRRIPRYNVILWDSDDHSYEYVERMLRELFGHTPEECHKMAETVDTQGKVIVLTTTKEHAELKRDQILAYGKDELMQELQRLDARDDRIGWIRRKGEGGRGKVERDEQLRAARSNEAVRIAHDSDVYGACRRRMKRKSLESSC